MATEFNIGSFFARWIFAVALVFGTYNPSDYSYVSWVVAQSSSFGPIMALIAVILLIGWVVFLRATMMSLGILGILLGGALFACIIWWFIDMELLSLDASGALTWIILLVMSFILAAGMSWSHIRRRLTGQFDVDEKDG
tara:strand:+ start:1298 stop:1714 length:417 start_codon:yes stop_codon:yes gene_type:complete